MNPTTDPASLDRLHDIVVPQRVPFWPPATAWWWIGGLALALLTVGLLRLLLIWQHNRYRREALAELSRCEASLEDPARCAATVAVMAELLKRCAVTAWPRDRVASLTGPAWFEFLDRSAGMQNFSQASGKILELVSCDPSAASTFDKGQLRVIVLHVRQWIKRHRVAPEEVAS